MARAAAGARAVPARGAGVGAAAPHGGPGRSDRRAVSARVRRLRRSGTDDGVARHGCPARRLVHGHFHVRFSAAGVSVLQVRPARCLLIAISAASFGTLAIFGRFLYAEGLDTFTLLFLRFSFAASIMALILILLKQPFPRGKILLQLVGMGAKII